MQSQAWCFSRNRIPLRRLHRNHPLGRALHDAQQLPLFQRIYRVLPGTWSTDDLRFERGRVSTRRKRFADSQGALIPLNVYGYSKLLFDDYVRRRLPAIPTQVVGLRFFNVYGPGEGHKGPMASLVYHLDSQMREVRGAIEDFFRQPRVTAMASSGAISSISTMSLPCAYGSWTIVSIRAFSTSAPAAAERLTN